MNRKGETGDSVQLFVKTAKRLGLLSEAHSRELVNQVSRQSSDPATVAIQSGWLTPADVDIVECLSRPVEVIPGYEIRDILGRGGMGVVFLARQLALDRDVALKTILGSFVADPIAMQRFEKEAKVIGRLIHPHVVTAFDFGRQSGRLFLAMELLTGTDAQKLVQSEGPLPERQAWGIIRQAASGLAYAASNGVVHRDIKPANLMLVEPPPGIPIPAGEPLVKVADFGLAILPSSSATGMGRLTATMNTIGSPQYMSPEQFNHEDLDERTDIYSLGVTLWEMLAGKNPFAELAMGAMIAKKLSGAFPPLTAVRTGLNRKTIELIGRMTAMEPEKRPQNYDDLLASIDRVLAALPEAKAPPKGSGIVSILRKAKAGEIGVSSKPVDGFEPTRQLAKRAREGQMTGDTDRNSDSVAQTQFFPKTDPARRTARPIWVGLLLIASLVGLIGVGVWLNANPPRGAEGLPRTWNPPKVGPSRDGNVEPVPVTPVPPKPPPPALVPGPNELVLFDGRSLRGWLIEAGTWSQNVDEEDGACLTGLDGEARRRISYQQGNQTVSLRHYIVRLSMKLGNAAFAEVQTDLTNPRSPSGPSNHYAMRLTPTTVELGLQNESKQDWVKGTNETEQWVSVPKEVGQSPHEVRIELREEGWMFYFDDELIGKRPMLRANPVGEFKLRVDSGEARFFDLLATELVHAEDR